MRVKIIAIIMCFCFFLQSGCGKAEAYHISLEEEIPNENEVEQEAEQLLETDSAQMCLVFLCGAVQNPGVYEVETGTRLYQVIHMAGGFHKDADEEFLNQAKEVLDGEKIRVPTKGEVEAKEIAEVESEESADGKVNINQAQLDELCTIPTIGEVRAQAILQYREEKGEFRSVEDIKNVTGIKEGTFEKIKDYIKIE